MVRYLFYNCQVIAIALPGLYSGIFLMYLYYCTTTRKEADKGKSILFYALCVLYALSAVTIGLDLAIILASNVSKNRRLCLT